MTRTRLPRPERRDQLLDTAEDLFTERGFGAVTVDDVAEHAGVTKPVVYDHFGSKDGLLAAVVERSGERLLVALAAAVEGRAGRDALEAGLLAYFRFVDQHAGAWALLLREVAPGTAAAEAVERVRAAQVGTIAELVGVQLGKKDSRRALTYAHVVSGAAERISAVRLNGPRQSPEQATRLLLEVLWTGFARLVEEA